MLDLVNYPHIAEAIVDALEPEVLPRIREVSHWFRSLAEARLYAHLRHDIGSDKTTTTILPNPLVVDLWTRTPEQLQLVRALDVHLGEYNDPNEIEIDWNDFDEGISEVGGEWQEDSARVLPRLPRLEDVVLYGDHNTVFRHVLQNRHVPTVIAPLRQRSFPSEDLFANRAVTVGAYLPTNRLIVPHALPPNDGAVKLQLFKEKPVDVVIVFLTREGHPDTYELFYENLLRDVVLEASDLIGSHTMTEGETYPDVPAIFTFVGLETWDKLFPRERTWKEILIKDFRDVARIFARPRDMDEQMKRLRVMTLEEWRRDEITEAEWDMIKDLDLS